MTHIHWVARQNKLEIPRDKDEVKQREIRESDGQAHDPDTMVAPLTPKPTRKAETLARAPPTIASRREEDAALKEVAMLPRYRCASCILETKTTDGCSGGAGKNKKRSRDDVRGRYQSSSRRDRAFADLCMYRSL